LGIYCFNGRFCSIKDNKITILVNDAENASTVNATEAETAFEAARTAFETAANQKEKIETNLALKRAKVRYQISQNT
jgi:F0F1-type ATP synthase epsilon subunit